MTTFDNNGVGDGDVTKLGEWAARDSGSSQVRESTSAESTGMLVSMATFILALILCAVWADSHSSFERCIGINDANDRMACYEDARHQEMRPPAKGATAPAALSHLGAGQICEPE
jgi:hypothetical protein